MSGGLKCRSGNRSRAGVARDRRRHRDRTTDCTSHSALCLLSAIIVVVATMQEAVSLIRLARAPSLYATADVDGADGCLRAKRCMARLSGRFQLPPYEAWNWPTGHPIRWPVKVPQRAQSGVVPLCLRAYDPLAGLSRRLRRGAGALLTQSRDHSDMRGWAPQRPSREPPRRQADKHG